MTPAIEAFVKCGKDRIERYTASKMKKRSKRSKWDFFVNPFNSTPHSRHKRFIDPLTGFLIVMGIVVAVGFVSSIVTGVFQGNRISALEVAVNKTHNDLQTAMSIRNETLHLIDELGKKVSSNAVAIDHLASLLPVIAFQASSLSRIIAKETEMFERMTEACKSEQASVGDYSRMFGLNLTAVKPDDTYVHSIKWESESKDYMNIELYYIIRSTDSRIYEVKSLPKLTNYTEGKLILWDYARPSFVLYNHTSDCLIGVEDPAVHSIRTRCVTNGFEDPKIDNWIKRDLGSSDYNEIKRNKSFMRPVIVKTMTQSIIQCFTNEIEFENHTKVDCPPFAFQLSSAIPFKLLDEEHEAISQVIIVRERETFLKSPQLNYFSINSEWSSAVSNLVKKNLNSVSEKSGPDGVIFNLDFNTILMIAGGAVLCIIMFACAGVVCAKLCQQAVNVGVNLNDQAPQRSRAMSQPIYHYIQQRLPRPPIQRSPPCDSVLDFAKGPFNSWYEQRSTQPRRRGRRSSHYASIRGR